MGSFNKLYANEALIDDLKVKNISLTQDSLSIKTDSPFQIGDILVTKKKKSILINNQNSKLSNNIIHTIQDEEFLTKLIFKEILDDNIFFTTYLCSVESKKGIYIENIIYNYNKTNSCLLNKIQTTSKKKHYGIWWSIKDNLGIMEHDKSISNRNIYYWERG